MKLNEKLKFGSPSPTGVNLLSRRRPQRLQLHVRRRRERVIPRHRAVPPPPFRLVRQRDNHHQNTRKQNKKKRPHYYVHRPAPLPLPRLLLGREPLPGGGRGRFVPPRGRDAAPPVRGAALASGRLERADLAAVAVGPLRGGGRPGADVVQGGGDAGLGQGRGDVVDEAVDLREVERRVGRNGHCVQARRCANTAGW